MGFAAKGPRWDRSAVLRPREFVLIPSGSGFALPFRTAPAQLQAAVGSRQPDRRPGCAAFCGPREGSTPQGS